MDENVVRTVATLLRQGDADKLKAWLDAGNVDFGDIWTIPVPTLEALAGKGSYFFKLEADGEIHGLVTCHPDANTKVEPAVYVGHLEAAPWNKPDAPDRKYRLIGKSLIEVAIRDSLRRGFEGRLILGAMEQQEGKSDLVGYYKKLGFTETPPGSRIMALDEQSAQRMLAEMEAERGD